MRLEISNGFAWFMLVLLFQVASVIKLADSAPSVQFHDRTFLPNTSTSAPVPRVGTLILRSPCAGISSLALGRQRNSQVPYPSLNHSHTTFMLDADGAVSRLRSTSSQNNPSFCFCQRLYFLRHVFSSSLSLVSLILTSQSSSLPFPRRSPPRLLTFAARGGLRPTPASRSRGAFPHLRSSIVGIFKAMPTSLAHTETKHANRVLSLAFSGTSKKPSVRHSAPSKK